MNANFRILEYQNFRILEFQKCEISEFQNFGISEFLYFRILEFQNFEILEFQKLGILKFWNFRSLEFQNFRILLWLAKFGFQINHLVYSSYQIKLILNYNHFLFLSWINNALWYKLQIADYCITDYTKMHMIDLVHA